MRAFKSYKKCLCCGDKYRIEYPLTKCICGGHLYIAGLIYQERPFQKVAIAQKKGEI